MKHRFSSMVVALCLSTACGPKQHDWDNIDYSSVYRKAAGREFDDRYRQPTSIGCVDEDLYNCK